MAARRKIRIPGPAVAIEYRSPGPVVDAFVRSDAFVAGIRGPIGSGKSTACVMKLLRNLKKQVPGPDNVIRRRIAVVRNTYPELKTTTLKTFHQWIPESYGEWREQGPPTHRICDFDADNPAVKLDAEFIFIALDRPEDVRKLLSMELSDAWINEAREIPKAIPDGLTGRLGRFPAERDGGCTDPQLIMDTNPPDTDHWWAKWADFPDPQTVTDNLELEAKLRADGAFRPDQKLSEFFSQPGGLSPLAENIKNLPNGYYERTKAGKRPEWVKVYIDGEYGFVIDGRPVYPEYRDNFHCKDFQLNRNLPIWVGIDFGLTPAATFAQRTIMGGWRVRSEITTEHMGAKRFAEECLRPHMNEFYRGFKFAAITGDPAGTAEAQSDETTPFQILNACGIEARPGPTNDPVVRRETVAGFLNGVVDGKPALMIHPDCQKLRKAMAGGYCYRRLQMADERYTDKPDKNMHSHVAESLQYLLTGAGESKTILRRDPNTYPRNRRKFAIMDSLPSGDW
ncbi:MAG: hypothetical protein WAU89_23330 [Candidatus Acidiferrales bacterium]